jgi:cytochrome c oxidase subunit 2
VGFPIKLTMTSEDVIHSFFIPAFRAKADVLPGRYSTLWFQANKLGRFHLFCSQYCGTEHSGMVGHVIVMEPHDYQAWLSGSKPARTALAAGDELFVAKACSTCHRPDTAARAPILAGLIGRSVKLQDGRVLTADESYIRESILNPQAKIVEGYQPLMPTFQGQLSEDEIIQLIEYVKSLKSSPETPGSAVAAGSGVATLRTGAR